MTKSQILENFFKAADDELLKKLIEVYNQSLDLSEDERVNGMVAKLESVFVERLDASQQD